MVFLPRQTITGTWLGGELSGIYGVFGKKSDGYVSCSA